MFVCEACLPKQIAAASTVFAVAKTDEKHMCICEKSWATFSLVVVFDIFNVASEDDWGIKSHYLSTFNIVFKNLS